MLKQTYPAIKAAAPNVNVIMGALAYDNFEASTSPGFNTGGHGCGAFNYRFFDDVLAAGAGSHFDAFAFDAYGVFGVGWEQQADANGAYDIAAKTNYLRARFPVIRSKEVFILESGIWSDDSVHLPVRMPDRSLGSVAPNQEWQAGYPGKLFARGLSVNLKGVVWYGIRDQANDQQRGLLDQSGQPKRSFRAYQQAATSLAGATFQATLAPRAVASGLPEGYVFRTSSGARLVVVWAVGDLAARARVTIDMPGGNVRAFDVVGGAVSGLQVSGDAVTLEVGHAPVYLLSG
jgi:hypothetical protein